MAFRVGDFHTVVAHGAAVGHAGRFKVGPAQRLDRLAGEALERYRERRVLRERAAANWAFPTYQQGLKFTDKAIDNAEKLPPPGSIAKILLGNYTAIWARVRREERRYLS